MKIPLTRPYLPSHALDELRNVLESGMLTEGETTRKFEQAVGSYLGVRHVLAVCNCTLGIEMALRALCIGADDEVIVPDFTYPATATAALQTGAKVVLVDIDPRTMLIDYHAIERTISSRTRAILPVSLFGNPLDYKVLNHIRSESGLLLVEDAACALGARFDNRPVGGLADITVFSLHPRKFITTGEGGLVSTNDSTVAAWMESYKHFGMAPKPQGHYSHFTLIGTNLKLSNIQAALGVGQLMEIDTLLEQRKRMAERYIELLKGIAGVELPSQTPGGSHSWQSFVVYVENRDVILEKMRHQGVEVQIGTYSLHMEPAFKSEARCIRAGNLTGSRYAFEHSLTLPLYANMTENEQDIVIDTLSRTIQSHG